jgi:hypothetical protein
LPELPEFPEPRPESLVTFKDGVALVDEYTVETTAIR